MSASSAVIRVSFSRVCKLHKIRKATIRPALNLPRPPCPRSRHFSVSPSAAPSEPAATAPPTPADSAHTWRIVSAVCVQRMPSLTREKTALECDYQQLSDQVRVERSKLSDYELEELEYERVKKARIKKAQEEDIASAKTSSGEVSDTFEDLQEFRELELQDFRPASRQTEADLSGDMQSLNRRLDRVLYLLVKKPREEHAWQMPQGSVETEESLLQAAQREFSEECGSEMKINFYSPTPVAVFSYHHHPLHSGHTKSKVFFLKAFHQGGVLRLDQQEVVDHVWVTREEMGEYVSGDYYRAVQPILTD